MMLSAALVSALVAPAAPAPAPGPAPAAADVVAPAPAPGPAVAGEVVAPPPGPAPRTVMVPPFEAGDSWATPQPSTPRAQGPAQPIVVDSGAAPVVITVAPQQAPTLSPPAPTWGPVRPSPPPPYDAARTLRTMRTFRRGAVGVFAVGSLGMAGALGLQWVRAKSLQRCIDAGTGSRACSDTTELSPTLGQYSALGMAMFVVGSAGAGGMLGNAAATRDVQLKGGDIRKRSGLKLLGGIAVGAATAWMLGANWTLLRHESACGGDPSCIGRYRPLRWAANDGAALGIAAGAGMLGYAIAYERQGKALMTLRAAPSVSATHTGVAMRMRF